MFVMGGLRGLHTHYAPLVSQHSNAECNEEFFQQEALAKTEIPKNLSNFSISSKAALCCEEVLSLSPIFLPHSFLTVCVEVAHP